MVLVFNTTQTGISSKVGGNIIKGMDRVLFGLLIPKISSEGSIQEIGKKTKNRAEEPCSIKMETGMMACGWTTLLMEKEE